LGNPRFILDPSSHEKSKLAIVQSDNSSPSNDEGEGFLGSMEELSLSPIQAMRNLMEESDSSDDSSEQNGSERILADESAYTCFNEAHSLLAVDNQLLQNECIELKSIIDKTNDEYDELADRYNALLLVENEGKHYNHKSYPFKQKHAEAEKEVKRLRALVSEWDAGESNSRVAFDRMSDKQKVEQLKLYSRRHKKLRRTIEKLELEKRCLSADKRVHEVAKAYALYRESFSLKYGDETDDIAYVCVRALGNSDLPPDGFLYRLLLQQFQSLQAKNTWVGKAASIADEQIFLFWQILYNKFGRRAYEHISTLQFNAGDQKHTMKNYTGSLIAPTVRDIQRKNVLRPEEEIFSITDENLKNIAEKILALQTVCGGIVMQYSNMN
jgi:hypothetical protein